MRGLHIALVVLACAACSTVAQQQRRVVRVRQRVLAAPQEEEQHQQQQQQQVAEARSAQAQQPEVQYYHVVPESEEYQAPQRAAAPVRQQAYLPRADTQRAIHAGPRTRDPLATRAPPVQTIRNFNTINDDGSFTFGYEAADGSFKEETRGVDCVVRGKYGYIDPEGNKREFTYVSGNPCDPNNPDPEEDDRSIEEEDSEENVPLRRPVPVVRPNVVRTRPAHAAPAAPATTLFQNAYQGQRLSSNSIEQPAAPVAVTPRPVARPTVAVTARPVTRQQTVYATGAPTATTYRPQIQNYPTVTSTAAPPVTRNLIPAYAVTPSSGAFDFDAELQKFDLKSASPTPASRPLTTSFQAASPYNPTAQPSAFKTASPAAARPAGNPYYNSQLIFDPATGQYNTVLYQQLPKGVGDFTHNTRLQPYVHQPQQHQPQQQLYHQQQLSQPSPFSPNYQALRAGPSEQLRAAPARYPANVVGAPQGAQQSFYYINPSLRNQFSTGQIDSFLKGHNLQI